MSQKELNELTREGYSCHTWSNDAGFWYPVHDHPYDKAIVILQGSITFYFPAKKEELVMQTGDRLNIPARTAHGASVGSEGVTCLEGQRSLSK
jgi:quercetin dioxygenase-like cupin family protein